MERTSYAIAAFQTLKEKVSTKPDGLFGHQIRLKTGGVTLDGDQLDIEFDIPFDDDTEANESELIVYNLSDTTRKQIKKGDKLTLEVGYQNDTGIILSGYISRVKNQWEGVDQKTIISVLDNNNLKEHDITSLAYKKGTKASTILKALVNKVGLPVTVFKPVRDYTYKDKVNVDGGLMENIRKYAKVCGVSAYICKGKIYVRSLKDGDNIQFIVCEETGLLSVEEFEEESTAEGYKNTIQGLNLTMLLQHRMTTAAIVTVKSRNYNGQYRIRSGRHTYNGTDFITEIEVI